MRKRMIIDGRQKVRSAVLLAVFIIMGCSPSDNRDIRFEYKFSPGETLRYKIISSSKVTTDLLQTEGLGDLQIPVAMETETEYLFSQKTVNVDQAGIAELELFYEAIKEKQAGAKIGTSVLSVGTSTLPEEKKTPLLKPLEGKTLRLKVGRDGYIMELSRVDEIVNQSFEGIQEDEETIRAKSRLRKAIGDLIEKSIYSFPMDEFNPGDMWIREDNIGTGLPGGGKIKLVHGIDGTVISKGDECRKVDLHSTVLSLDETKGLLKTIKDKQMRIEYAGKGEGIILFAPRPGRLIESELAHKVTVDVYPAGVSEQQAVIKINIDTKTTMVLQ